MRIGVWELVVIFLAVLLVLGPERLPQYARKLGAALRELRRTSEEVGKELRENVAEPLAEAAKPLREAMEPPQERERDGRAARTEAAGQTAGAGRGTEAPPAADSLPEREAQENGYGGENE